MNHFDPTVLALGTLAFAAHFVGKWSETPLPFRTWIAEKATKVYWITATLLCIVALIMQPQWSGAMGMEPNTYSLVMGYGGGHLVSRFLGVTKAQAEKRIGS